MAVRTLSICSGVAGLELGLSLVLPIVPLCYVERQAYAAAVLAAQMEEGNLAPAPVWSDVKTFPEVAHLFSGKVDLLTGGYPCQPFSSAGRRKGIKDPRHIFPDICRIIEAVKPSVLFFENVENHINEGFPEVYTSLRDLGYAVEAGIFSAEEVGGNHQRRRLFILAHNKSLRCGGRGGEKESQVREGEFLHNQRWFRAEKGCQIEGCCDPVADSDFERLEGRVQSIGERAYKFPFGPPSPKSETWNEINPALYPAVKSDFRGVVDGTSVVVDRYRVPRIMSLGNAVVPLTAAVAFTTLAGKFEGGE